ncbi:Gfo/Idh/MocA family protein [Anaerobaca lacustris]|uniref:Gfo/Idh/MocA family oxidoreductase n=1 Tax=Anaerobaca lacustris TaxID=3044600 RepID=A0AAW6TWJ2_9BACT|nr:Gfo/Idh/MocA family oxidoreductase [Sedimentisphaerales bacterium M17dextr]
MPQTQNPSPQPSVPASLSRRRFMAGAAAASFAIVAPGAVRTFAANAKINIGMVGCGGRGTWIGRLFRDHGGYNVVAAADYFEDRTNRFGEELGVPASHRYTGLKGYLKLMDKVDAVVIKSPPYFHPEQAAAAVAAGKHTYVAKPIAVDVPGCLSIEDSGKTARQKKRCFLIDFQTRADPFYIEALRRVHQENALGKFAFGECTYHAGDPFGGMYDAWRSDPDNPENRMRAWGLDRVLSGDIITEQNIHTLDVMNWIMDAPPLWAVGSGGRKFRPVGTCYDTFSLLFQYANDVAITFSSRQSNGYGTQPEGIRNRMFGTEGILETEYGGQVLIRGDHFYRGGKSPGIYQDGAVANIKTFYDSITTGNFENPTVECSVRSNLITVLGRMAAYEKRMVTWNELMSNTEKLDANLKGLKA